MAKKINLLYGIVGGFALAILQLPLYLGIQNFGDMGGYRIESIIKLLTWAGMLAVAFFSILLIIQSIKEF